MKSMLYFSFSLLGLLLCACTEAKQTHCMPIVAAYPTWSANQLPLESIPWHKFTHITLTFVLPNADGSLQTKDMDQIIDTLVKLAHEKNKKVFISIGGAIGYGDAFQKIAGDKDRLKLFSTNVKAYVQAHQIDGVDIDWEYWTKQAVHKQGGNDPVESRFKSLSTDMVDIAGVLKKCNKGKSCSIELLEWWTFFVQRCSREGLGRSVFFFFFESILVSRWKQNQKSKKLVAFLVFMHLK